MLLKLECKAQAVSGCYIIKNYLITHLTFMLANTTVIQPFITRDLI